MSAFTCSDFSAVILQRKTGFELTSLHSSSSTHLAHNERTELGLYWKERPVTERISRTRQRMAFDVCEGYALVATICIAVNVDVCRESLAFFFPETALPT